MVEIRKKKDYVSTVKDKVVVCWVYDCVLMLIWKERNQKRNVQRLSRTWKIFRRWTGGRQILVCKQTDFCKSFTIKSKQCICEVKINSELTWLIKFSTGLLCNLDSITFLRDSFISIKNWSRICSHPPKGKAGWLILKYLEWTGYW